MALNKDSMLSAEYSSLRTEILQRISTRYTVINFTLILFAAALGFQKSSLVLLYPVIACFLLGKYVSNEHTKDELTNYIFNNIEQPVSKQYPDYIGWQHFKEMRSTDKLIKWGKWLFVITEVATLVAAWGIQQPDSAYLITVLNIQYLVAVVFTLITVALVFSPDRPVLTSPTQQEKPT